MTDAPEKFESEAPAFLHPAPLDEAQLQARLVEAGPYARVQRVESIGSTNAHLVQQLSDPATRADWPHLSVLTAELQTGGVGRHQRAWSSPRGTTLSTSVVLTPKLPAHELSWLSLLAGVALVHTLREDFELPAAMKWPNDVHVHGRKISGILAARPALSGAAQLRTGPTAFTQPPVILGCGINVLLEQDQLPTPTATSVLLERQRLNLDTGAQTRTDLLTGHLLRFAELLARAEAAGSAVLHAEVASVMDTLGAQVRLELPDGSAVAGTAISLEVDGNLNVEVQRRRDEKISAAQASDPAGGGADHLWRALVPYREQFAAADVVHLRRQGS